jgi:hypothetical protein
LLRDVERVKRERVWMGMLRIPVRKKIYLRNSRPPLMIGDIASALRDSLRGVSYATRMLMWSVWQDEHNFMI